RSRSYAQSTQTGFSKKLADVFIRCGPDISWQDFIPDGFSEYLQSRHDADVGRRSQCANPSGWLQGGRHLSSWRFDWRGGHSHLPRAFGWECIPDGVPIHEWRSQRFEFEKRGYDACRAEIFS